MNESEQTQAIAKIRENQRHRIGPWESIGMCTTMRSEIDQCLKIVDSQVQKMADLNRVGSKTLLALVEVQEKIAELTTENNGRALAMDLQKHEIERLQNGKTIGSLHHQIVSLEVKLAEQAKEIERLKEQVKVTARQVHDAAQLRL